MKKVGEILCTVLALASVGLLLWSFFIHRPNEGVKIERTTDTVIMRDTIRDTIPKLVHVHHYRTDTVTLRVAGDTAYIAVEVPIERKTYATDDYKAVIEGFRPQLVSMELYPQVKYITNTEIRTITPRLRRWGLGVQVGYGFTPQKAQPYIGVGVQYNLFTW